MSFGGGGKGGSQTVKNETVMPEWYESAAQNNIGRADTAASIGYMPYYGPQVAAFSPFQTNSMDNSSSAAQAFGLLGGGGTGASAMGSSPAPSAGPTTTTPGANSAQYAYQGGGYTPTPQEYAGGIQGYGSGNLFEEAVAEFERRRPGQAEAYNSLFVDPNPNQAAEATAAAQAAQAATINAQIADLRRQRAAVGPTTRMAGVASKEDGESQNQRLNENRRAAAAIDEQIAALEAQLGGLS